MTVPVWFVLIAALEGRVPSRNAWPRHGPEHDVQLQLPEASHVVVQISAASQDAWSTHWVVSTRPKRPLK